MVRKAFTLYQLFNCHCTVINSTIMSRNSLVFVFVPPHEHMTIYYCSLSDASHWIISNQHFLYSTSVQPLRIETVNHHAIPDYLTTRGYNHIGDIDCFEDIIYGGIEGGDSSGYLAKWNATDLTFLSATETELHGVPWVAVDYDQREIYAANWNDCCEFSIYSIDDFPFLRTLTVSNMPAEIQGSAFYQGDLYVSSNINVSVHKIDVTTGETTFVLSDDYIEKHLYEMEGLTFWDLEERQQGPGLGTMHLFGNFMEVKEKAIRNFKV